MPDICWSLLISHGGRLLTGNRRRFTPSVGQNFVRAAGDELSGNACPNRGRLASRPSRGPAHNPAAVERDNNRNQLDRLLVEWRGERADRSLTAAAKRRNQGPLGLERRTGRRIVKARYQATDCVVAFTGFDRHRALARRRHTRGGRQRHRDARGEAKTPQSGSRQNERIILAGVEFSEPRVEVAPDGDESRAGKDARQLRHTTHASGPNSGRLPEMRDELID